MLRLFGFSVPLCVHCVKTKFCLQLQVLLIGESGVGKSTLVGRLCEDRFMPEHRQYTLGKFLLFLLTFSLGDSGNEPPLHACKMSSLFHAAFWPEFSQQILCIRVYCRMLGSLTSAWWVMCFVNQITGRKFSVYNCTFPHEIDLSEFQSFEYHSIFIHPNGVLNSLVPRPYPQGEGLVSLYACTCTGFSLKVMKTVFFVNVRVMLMSLSWLAKPLCMVWGVWPAVETRIEFDSALQHSLCRLGAQRKAVYYTTMAETSSSGFPRGSGNLSVTRLYSL